MFRQEDLDIVILMETKRSAFCNRRIVSIWKRRRVEWDVLDSIGLLEGYFFHVEYKVVCCHRGS